MTDLVLGSEELLSLNTPAGSLRWLGTTDLHRLEARRASRRRAIAR